MNRSRLTVRLAALAVLCFAGALLQWRFSPYFSALAAFPLEQIGLGLRLLSLGSTAGNLLAWVLYGCIGLAPLCWLGFRLCRGRAVREDGLLVCLSIALFAALYLLANPGDLARLIPAGGPLGPALLGGTVYSLLIAYGVLRILRAFAAQGAPALARALQTLTALLCAGLVLAVFGVGLSALLEKLARFSADNTDGGPLALSYAVLILQFVMDSVPQLAALAVLLSGRELLHVLEAGPYGPAAAPAAQKTGRLCRNALAAVALTQAGFNALQLLLAPQLRSIGIQAAFPFVSLAFFLAALLLTRYFEEGRALKEDNDLIV